MQSSNTIVLKMVKVSKLVQRKLINNRLGGISKD